MTTTKNAPRGESVGSAPAAPPTADAPSRRCAIYTRTSTPDAHAPGILAAQRAVCLAYVRRQPDWVALPTRYADRGTTCAEAERPALQQLLDDVDAGQIDVIVVYKLDRLCRSPIDLRRLLDRFRARGVAFVATMQIVKLLTDEDWNGFWFLHSHASVDRGNG